MNCPSGISRKVLASVMALALPRFAFSGLMAAVLFLAVEAGLFDARGQAIATAPAPPSSTPAQQDYLRLSFEQWKAACDRLPSNRALAGRIPARNLLPLPAFRDFDVVLSLFLENSRSGFLSQKTNWLGAFPSRAFFDPQAAYFLKSSPPTAFEPFAQVLNIPLQSEVFFRGDLHGDVHSLMANMEWLNKKGYLEGFHVVKPRFYLVFLGDFTDRGVFGIEVLYTLLRLKLANPERVFLLRGNHEEVSLQARYGFFQEGAGKYGSDFNAAKVSRLNDFLPVVLYLGSGDNYIQCNHGGMEPGFNPRHLLKSGAPMGFQLLGTLMQQQFLKKNPQWLARSDAGSRQLASRALQDFRPSDPNSPTVLGFVWNDFTVHSNEADFSFDPARAFVYGQRPTEFLLESASTDRKKLRAVFRGHQHSSSPNPLMNRLVASAGLFRHWQVSDVPALSNAARSELQQHLETSPGRSIPPGSVWTFNVSPDSAYGVGCNYTFDAFGLLTTAKEFSEWRVQVINVEPAK